MIIGISATISGKQSGKDTFASLCSSKLKEHGIPVQVVHFATPLKDACKILFGISKAEETKDCLSSWDWPKNNSLGNTGKMTNRQIWQFFGTNIMRDNWQQDIWVRITKKYIDDIQAEYPGYVFFIPDVRFPNEVEHIDMLVDIYRPSILEKNKTGSNTSFGHISEQAGKLIPEEKFTLKVVNDTTISNLEIKANDFVLNSLLETYQNRGFESGLT